MDKETGHRDEEKVWYGGRSGGDAACGAAGVLQALAV